jgi:hypothetical protein
VEVNGGQMAGGEKGDIRRYSSRILEGGVGGKRIREGGGVPKS